MIASVLCARSDSEYFNIPGLNVFDLERDAFTHCDNYPVIAHPPCRSWGRLRKFAKPAPTERALALFCVDEVRRCGGVLEHPSSSTLWQEALLPSPGSRDSYGGFTLPLQQSDFGHRAPKNTWLYICGIEPRQVPVMPLILGLATGRIELMGNREREATPIEFAHWLVDLAITCQTPRRIFEVC